MDRRLTDFGQELDRAFEVHDNCYDCAAFYDGCKAWPAAKDFACRIVQPLPDVTLGTYGQKFPAGTRKLPDAPVDDASSEDPPGDCPDEPGSEGEEPDDPPSQASFRVPKALAVVVKAECAKQCDGCLVRAGLPCGYFERAVLGPPDYKYRAARPGPKARAYDWEKVWAAYGRINPDFSTGGAAVRRCECGAVLGRRERLCEKCRTRRRRDSYRRRRQNDRRATVN